jgi:hypothetical protein
MKKLRSIAVTLIVFTALGAMMASDLYVPTERERPIAVVKRFKPVVVLANATDSVYTLKIEENTGERLFSGDTLTTESDGYALVIFSNDGSVAKVKPDSRLVVRGESIADSKISDRRIDLEQGEIYLEMEPQGSATFEVSTSRSLASVKGTKFGNRAMGYVWVDEGQVDLTATNSGQTISLFEKMYGQVDDGGNGVQSGTLSDDELNDLNSEYDQLDEDYVEKTIQIQFRDANGQIRTVEVEIFEKGN